MADKDADNQWAFQKSTPSSEKVKNDPWSPGSIATENIPKISPAPSDPLRTLISSETYIESLEKKLKKIKGKTPRDLKASDMIQTLQTAKDTQVAQMIDTDQSDIFSEEADNIDSSVMQSIQRRLNPDKQAVNPVELMPLVNADVLAKVTEESDKDNSDSGIK